MQNSLLLLIMEFLSVSEIIIATIVFLVSAYFWSERRPKGFPPGPYGFPILGHFPLLGTAPHKTAADWKPKYGPVLGLRFGSLPCVVISDYHLAKQALSDPAFLGRPKIRISSERSGGGAAQGIAFSEGRIWREQRNFTHRRLREIGGFGTRSMEAIIMPQVEDVIQELRAEAGCPVSLHSRFNLAFWNALWAIIAGEPMQRSDPALHGFIETFIAAIQNNDPLTMISVFIPWVADWLPSRLSGADALKKIWIAPMAMLQPYIDEHWQSHAPGQPRDFIDAYIDEIKATTETGSSFHPIWSRWSMVSTLVDLFHGGIETGATALQWICLFLAAHPRVQEKLAAEIEAVIGAGGRRPPSLTDRKQMPYTEAVIHEVFRMQPILPLGVFRSTMEQVQLAGYTIPKDTVVFINIHEAHYNKELWGDPEEFRPERWLQEGEFVRREGWIPFSSGKRVCPGEQMGRDEVFLFTVGLVQEFRITTDPGDPEPSLEAKLGGTIFGPRPHKLVFNIRNE